VTEWDRNLNRNWLAILSPRGSGTGHDEAIWALGRFHDEIYTTSSSVDSLDSGTQALGGSLLFMVLPGQGARSTRPIFVAFCLAAFGCLFVSGIIYIAVASIKHLFQGLAGTVLTRHSDMECSKVMFMILTNCKVD